MAREGRSALEQYLPEPSPELLQQFVNDFAERMCAPGQDEIEWRRNWRNYFIGVYMLEMYDIDAGELLRVRQDESVEALNDAFNEHLRQAAAVARRPFNPHEFSRRDWNTYFTEVVYTRSPQDLQEDPWVVIAGLHEEVIDYTDL